MPLVSMTDLLARARCGTYAVCYCESWNLESFQAVLEAAEELSSPIIVGFNGGFLMHSQREKPENIAYYAGMALAIRGTSVPVALLLNETGSLTQIKEAIDEGFTGVMVENEHLDLNAYRRLVKEVVELAHRRGVCVEAQIGSLRPGSGDSAAETTDPVIARAFVRATCIDALAVAVGNVHVLTVGKAQLDLGALEKIRDAVGVPLALHGGTGVPLELAQCIIRLGVAKVNFGTVLKQSYLSAIREKLAAYREPMSPHSFLGIGGREDILVAGREAVKLKVKELLEAYGSAGKGRLTDFAPGARGNQMAR